MENHSKIRNIAILFFLVLVLPMVMFLTGNIQAPWKKAVGEGSLKVYLQSSKVANQLKIGVRLENISALDQDARAGSVYIGFDPSVLIISGIGSADNPCNAESFPTKIFAGVKNSNVLEISCYNPQTAATGVGPTTIFPAAGENKDKAFANFDIAFKSTSTATSAALSIVDARIPKYSLSVNESNLINLAGATRIGVTVNRDGTIVEGLGINLKVKFRDVSTRPASCYADKAVQFKARLVKSGIPPHFFDPLVIVNNTNISEAGIWNIKLGGFNKVAGTYDLYLKGPKQLQKKIPGIKLTSAEDQTIDIVALGSRYYLEGGDLPVPTQDGVVNSIDATNLVNCFADPDGTACIAKADLNFDCIVNTQDVNLINNTIYTRWEDDEQQ